ncbi:YlbF family regulator [Haploplasma axanthum]|uniref:Protein of uncharacterized function (DUF964) n=1 Tax=Haploplasma axanthum TaxID=29552 RepID=A0A449BFK4_HAPAX|nr:YlbF family regulator [Haploplasma axanthum]VEU81222.1 Protein of uncharacterised function (DUF964) [Haploplasma axanthum]
MTDLLLLAYDYVDEFKNKDYYQEYISLSKMIDDKYYDDLIKVNKIKEEYDAVLEYGRYHPDFKDVTKKYSEAKKKLFEIDDIKRYFELDRIIEEEINEFLNKVTSSISENIPVFNKFGFITKKGGSSCSGNCR